MAKFCKQCGTQLKDDAVFCPQCGTKQHTQSFPSNNVVPPKAIDHHPLPPDPTSSSKSTPILIFIIIALVVGIGAYFIMFDGDTGNEKAVFSNNTESKKNVVIENETKQPQPTNDNTNQSQKLNNVNINNTSPNKALDSSELSLGNLSIGDTTATLKAAMGQPDTIVNQNNQIHWKYNNVDVIIANNVISELISNNASISTPRGIHEGSPIGDVFTKYGNNYRDEVFNNTQLYEYPITSKDGAPCLLRFAVRNGENTVYYISMRKVQ